MHTPKHFVKSTENRHHQPEVFLPQQCYCRQHRIRFVAHFQQRVDERCWLWRIIHLLCLETGKYSHSWPLLISVRSSHTDLLHPSKVHHQTTMSTTVFRNRSIRRALLFLIYTIDLCEKFNSAWRLFREDLRTEAFLTPFNRLPGQKIPPYSKDGN